MKTIFIVWFGVGRGLQNTDNFFYSLLAEPRTLCLGMFSRCLGIGTFW